MFNGFTDRPKLKSNIIIKKIDNAGRVSYVLSKRGSEDRAYFGLNELTRFIVSLVNGENTIADIEKKTAAQFALENLKDDIIELLGILEKEDLLEKSVSEADTKGDTGSTRPSIPLYKRILQLSYAFKSDRLISAIYKFSRFLFTGPAILALTALFISGIVILIYTYQDMASFIIGLKASITVFNITLFFLGFFGVQFIVITIHEFMHGLVCKHFGGEQMKMGIMLYYFRPVFFCDTSDAWLFKKKHQRILVSLAGPLSTWIIGTFGAWLWLFSQNDITRIISLFLISLAFGNNLYIDLNPFLKYDGYYVLSDLLEIPNLREKAFNYLKVVFLKRLKTVPPYEYSNKEKTVFLIYGIGSFLYSTFAIVSGIFFMYILLAKFNVTGIGRFLLPLIILVSVIGLVLKPLRKLMKLKVAVKK